MFLHVKMILFRPGINVRPAWSNPNWTALIRSRKHSSSRKATLVGFRSGKYGGQVHKLSYFFFSNVSLDHFLEHVGCWGRPLPSGRACCHLVCVQPHGCLDPEHWPLMKWSDLGMVMRKATFQALQPVRDPSEPFTIYILLEEVWLCQKHPFSVLCIVNLFRGRKNNATRVCSLSEQ